MKNAVTVRVPTCLFHGLIKIQDTRFIDDEVINRIADYIVYSMKRHMNKSLKEVWKKLGLQEMSESQMQDAWKRGKEISEGITSKSFFFVDYHKMFQLRDKDPTFDKAIKLLMYYSLGSIQGKAKYRKCDNLMLLSRLDGNDKRLKDSASLSIDIARLNTRRKMERYKRLLTQAYNVGFYSKARGFYFSTKLNSEELKDVLSKDKADETDPLPY